MPILEIFMMRGSPPSYSVIALLKALKIPYKATELDYFGGEQFSAEHVKRNPQREVPVLKDGDFHLCESIAILQYLCDEYGKHSPNLYPKEAKKRAVINHRLAFNLGNFYSNVSAHVYYGVVANMPNKEELKSKAMRSLQVVEIILKSQNTKFAAGDEFTIADIAMMATACCLEAINFDFSPFPCIAEWFEVCKKQQPVVWEEFKLCRDELHFFVDNPPTLEALAKLEKMREESFKK